MQVHSPRDLSTDGKMKTQLKTGGMNEVQQYNLMLIDRAEVESEQQEAFK